MTDPRFRKGDRVRLSLDARKAAINPRTQRRRGIVSATPKTADSVAVIWDGTKTPQRFTPRFLVLVHRPKP